MLLNGILDLSELEIFVLRRGAKLISRKGVGLNFSLITTHIAFQEIEKRIMVMHHPQRTAAFTRLLLEVFRYAY